jgi:acyl-coenzyme A thioesterase PaaI-like protein
VFSRLVCWKASYFSRVRPAFVELRPGYCEVRAKKRRRVLNHIGTVDAIAMCNMAELTGGSDSFVQLSVDSQRHDGAIHQEGRDRPKGGGRK